MIRRIAKVLTDTHCHLDFKNFDEDRTKVMKRAWDAGLIRILNPGVNINTSQAAVHLAETEPKIFAAVGVHPNSSQTWDSQTLDALETLAGHPKVVAIGEIGLDYYRDRAPRKHQKRVFRNQLNLASQLNLPVVIHTRNTSLEDRECISDLIEILSEWRFNLSHPGVIHSYSGGKKEAERLLSLGFMIGITGPVTYKNASTLRHVVASMPLESLLIETDGPFLTPHPYRGKRNEPAYVRSIAEKISEVQHQSFQAVATQTSMNADRLFQWGMID